MCMCSYKREDRVEYMWDTHICTSTLIPDCSWSWHALATVGWLWWWLKAKPEDTTNHACRGRSVLEKRLIAVQGWASGAPISLRKMYVGTLVREGKEWAYKATVAVLWDEACQSVTFDACCLVAHLCDCKIQINLVNRKRNVFTKTTPPSLK